ncbi:hypothetical protein ACO0QE_002457 [Hanseniaspora vineae]
MKFGKTYGNHQIPEWSDFYLDYKQLKHTIRQISTQQDAILALGRETACDQDPSSNNSAISLSSSSIKEHSPDAVLTTLQNPKVKNLLSQFLIEFEKNIEKVDEFYNKQFSEYDRRLRRLLNDPTIIELQTSNADASGNGSQVNFLESKVQGLSTFSSHSSFVNSHDTMTGSNLNVHGMNDSHVHHYHHALPEKEEMDEYIAILVELRSNFRKLKWFGDLNKRACIKILKKLDKKCGTDQQQRFLQERIFSLDFSNPEEIEVDVTKVNDLLDLLSYDSKNLAKTLAKPANGKDNNDSEDGSPDIVTQLIQKDDERGLINELIYTYRSVVLIPTRLLVSLLNKAALLQSTKCIDEILEIIPSLEDANDINKRNFFHHHVIALGKNNFQTSQTKLEKSKDGVPLATSNSVGSASIPMTNSESASFYTSTSSMAKFEGLDDLLNMESNTKFLYPAMPPERQLIGAYGSDGINSSDSPNALKYILEKLPVHLRASLLKKDTYKRTPLHYAAQYGLVEVTKIIITILKSWDVWNPSTPIDDRAAWGDSDNLTPLHLAVMGTHPLTVKTLVSFVSPDVKTSSPKLLFLATRLNSPTLIESLLSINGFDVNYKETEKTGETALHVATRLNLLGAAKCLIKNGANTEIKDKNYGWTPVFIAASEGLEEMCKLLVHEGHCNIHAFDDSGWTPMEHAALRGHLKLSKMLAIDDPNIINPVMTMDEPERSKSPFPNQNMNKCFYKASTPSLVSLKDASTNGSSSNLSMETIIQDSKKSRIPTKKSIIEESTTAQQQQQQHMALDVSSVTSKAVKSFGHEFLKHTESFISITLGSNDTSNPTPAITLQKVPFAKASSTELDTALSLMITCQDSLNGEPCILDLPLDETINAVNFKVPFKTDMHHVVYFDLVPTYGVNPGTHKRGQSSETDILGFGSNGSFKHPGLRRSGDSQTSVSRSNALSQYGSLPLKRAPSQKPQRLVLGRAIALLDSANTRVGKNKRSLQDTITVPIISSENMDILGTVNFEFLLVNPFTPSNASFFDKTTRWLNSDTYWKQLVSTRVIGHRGLGKNIDSKKTLQLGENTVESFIAAASLGASYVEFDVQLTKDDVPVVYHDFLVAESGVDIPMHELTLEQFLDLNNINDDKKDSSKNLLDKNFNHKDENATQDKQKPGTETHSRRRRSVDDTDLKNSREKDAKASLESFWERRMRYTKTYKEKNYKGNFRGSSIASSFVTLKEVFQKLPKNVGFNVECKYPMTDEATKEDMSQIAIEMNHWIDTVLQTVYAHCGKRDIIFSSFNPDVCIMLSLKQPHFPVLYLTEAGSTVMTDSRALSLQSAVRFARTWNLLGIVSAAQPIVEAPRLAHIVKSSGLVLFTYGVLNNDPAIARREILAGVDAVIVDSVLAVRKGLTKEALSTSSNSSEESVNEIPS